MVRQVAEMGYVGVEPAGFPGTTPEAAGKLFAELGLAVPSAHVALPVGESKNEVLDTMPDEQLTIGGRRMRPIDTMLIVPSEDLRKIAREHRKELPFAIRALLRGVGGNRPGEDKLLSFLLFEQAYTRELIQLGYRDAMNVKDQLLDFVTGGEVPRLFAPDWVQRDLRELTPE